MQIEMPPRVTEDQIDSILDIRRRRADVFGEGLFSDPAWDILLELFAAELGNRKIMLADLTEIAPESTIARWVAALEERGLVECELDPLHTRQFAVALTADCAARMRRFLSGARHLARLV